MAKWTERVAEVLMSGSSPVVVAAGREWGLTAVLASLRERGGFGLIQSSPRLKRDPVAQGNALAAALNEATGSRLFSMGLEPVAQLARLQQYSSELTPLTLAIESAELAPELTALLLSQPPAGVHLVVEFTSSALVPDSVSEVAGEEFLLRDDEARDLAPPGLRAETALSELEVAGRKRPAFLNRLGIVRGELPELLPPIGLDSAGEYHSAELVINALLRQKRYEDALELAVQTTPRRVESVIRRAGPEFQRRGSLQRLHLLLSALDEPWATLENTLEWRLVAAVAAGDHGDLLAEVDAFLEVNPAPDLRARRAGLLSPERRQAVAAEALQLSRTPLTLWQAGRIHPDLGTAITLLQESVRLAEDEGTPYDIVRNAGTLAETYHHAGELRQALHWSQWALSVMDEAGISDVSRRTRILNNLVSSGILTGDTLGLQDRLRDATYLNLTGAPDVRANTTLTLSTLALAEGNHDEALALLAEATSGASRRLLAGTVLERVHILLAAGREAEAARAVEQALSFSSGEVQLIADNAQQAKEMLRALKGEVSALEPLLQLAAATDRPAVSRLTAWLYAQLLPGSPTEPPPDLRGPLEQLGAGGLRALSAPQERFEQIWQGLLGDAADLQLQTLGEPAALLRGTELSLTNRMWEVLLGIALHQHGISDEQLLDYLVRDGGGFGLSALRSHVSRLRSVVPVSETPYRLLVSYSLDVIELRKAVAAGELRRGLAFLRGPLLPDSTAEGVRELRADLEAELTQAALIADDAEVVYALAGQFADDLRLWERALDLLPAGDGRRAIAAARVRRLTAEYLN